MITAYFDGSKTRAGEALFAGSADAAGKEESPAPVEIHVHGGPLPPTFLFDEMPSGTRTALSVKKSNKGRARARRELNFFRPTTENQGAKKA